MMNENINGFFYTIFFVLLVITLYDSFVITKQKELKHLSLLGKYWRTASPGLSFKIPFLSRVDYTVSTAINEQTVHLRLKTKDQVTFELGLNIFYEITENPQFAYKAVYDLDNFNTQIASITTDSAIPIANGVSLEDVFDSKDTITNAAKSALIEYFEQYGIIISKVLSDEPKLPKEVEDSANEVIAAKRKNDAAKYNALAIKTEKVGEALADGESVRIRMEEIGKAREQYASTTASAISMMVKSGVNATDAMNFLARVGDQDALVTASRNSNATILGLGTTGGDAMSSSDVISLIAALGNKPSAQDD